MKATQACPPSSVVKIPVEVYHRIKTMAATEERSMKTVLNRLLRKGLDQEAKEERKP